MILRVLAVLAGVARPVAVAWFTEPGSASSPSPARRGRTKKVVWPSPQGNDADDRDGVRLLSSWRFFG